MGRLSLALALAAAPAWALAQAPAADAVMGACQGSVQVQRPGSPFWFLARKGRTLPAGSTLKTYSGASAEVLFSDGAALRLGPRTTFRFEAASSTQTTVAVEAGRLEAWVPAGRAWSARSPAVTASTREAVFVLKVPGPDEAALDVFSGELSAQDRAGRSFPIGPGQRAEIGTAMGLSSREPLPAGAAPPPRPARPARG